MRAISCCTRSVGTLFLSTAVSVVLFAHPATAQSVAARQVTQLLSRTVPLMATSGFSLRRTLTGAMDDRYYRDIPITLSAGTAYRIVGVCDADCDDLDLRIYDASGNEVDWDVDADDTPLLSVTPRRSQTYTLRVIMASCTDEPCSFGIGVYGTPQTSASSSVRHASGWVAAGAIERRWYI